VLLPGLPGLPGLGRWGWGLGVGSIRESEDVAAEVAEAR